MHRKKRNARKNQACPVTASEKLQVSDELAESPFLTEGQRGRAGGGRLGSGPKLATAGPTLGLPSLAANSEGRCGWPIPHYGGGGRTGSHRSGQVVLLPSEPTPPHPPPDSQESERGLIRSWVLRALVSWRALALEPFLVSPLHQSLDPAGTHSSIPSLPGRC